MARDTTARFGVDLPHFAAQCISFLIVAFVLHRYAYKPILIMLEERKKRIKEGLDNAEKIKQELANTQTRTHEIMVQAGQQAAKMIEEARAALVARGVEASGVQDIGGVKYVWFSDPDGNLWGLQQWPEGYQG